MESTHNNKDGAETRRFKLPTFIIWGHAGGIRSIWSRKPQHSIDLLGGTVQAKPRTMTQKDEPGLDNLAPEMLYLIFSYLSISEFFPLKLAGSHYLASVIRDRPHQVPSLDSYRSDLCWESAVASQHWDQLSKRPGENRRSLNLAALRGQNALIISLYKMRQGDLSRKYHEENEYDRSALSYAIQSGHMTTVELVRKLERQPLWWRDRNGASIMDYAARYGQLEMIEYLIRNSCDVAPSLKQRKQEYVKSRQGRKRLYRSKSSKASWPAPSKLPLVWAIKYGHVEMVKVLLRSGATKHLNSDSYGEHQSDNALEEALSVGNMEIVNCLRAAGALIWTTDLLYWPLRNNIVAKNVEMVRYLCENGAVLTNTGDLWVTNLPLHTACVSGNTDIIGILLDHGALIEQLQNGVSPLLKASSHDNIDAVRYLLQRGALPDGAGERGYTVLYEATRNENFEMMQLVIDHGASIVRTDSHGQTPLWAAVSKDTTKGLKILLNAGSDDEYRSDEWQQALNAALLLAASSGKIDAVEELLTHAADINTKGEHDGRTPLHKAAEKGHMDTLALLIQNGADVNARDKRQQTPAHTAIDEAVAALVSAGADVTLKDKSGKTVAEVLEYRKFVQDLENDDDGYAGDCDAAD